MGLAYLPIPRDIQVPLSLLGPTALPKPPTLPWFTLVVLDVGRVWTGNFALAFLPSLFALDLWAFHPRVKYLCSRVVSPCFCEGGRLGLFTIVWGCGHDLWVCRPSGFCPQLLLLIVLSVAQPPSAYE